MKSRENRNEFILGCRGCTSNGICQIQNAVDELLTKAEDELVKICEEHGSGHHYHVEIRYEV